MTKEDFFKEAEELGIVYTDAFENAGKFDEKLAQQIIDICREHSTPEKMREHVLHIDGSELFINTWCVICKYRNDKTRKNCPGYLPDCPFHNYDEFIKEHKEEILNKYDNR